MPRRKIEYENIYNEFISAENGLKEHIDAVEQNKIIREMYERIASILNLFRDSLAEQMIQRQLLNNYIKEIGDAFDQIDSEVRQSSTKELSKAKDAAFVGNSSLDVRLNDLSSKYSIQQYQTRLEIELFSAYTNFGQAIRDEDKEKAEELRHHIEALKERQKDLEVHQQELEKGESVQRNANDIDLSKPVINVGRIDFGDEHNISNLLDSMRNDASLTEVEKKAIDAFAKSDVVELVNSDSDQRLNNSSEEKIDEEFKKAIEKYENDKIINNLRDLVHDIGRNITSEKTPADLNTLTNCLNRAEARIIELEKFRRLDLAAAKSFENKEDKSDFMSKAKYEHKINEDVARIIKEFNDPRATQSILDQASRKVSELRSNEGNRKLDRQEKRYQKALDKLSKYENVLMEKAAKDIDKKGLLLRAYNTRDSLIKYALEHNTGKMLDKNVKEKYDDLVKNCVKEQTKYQNVKEYVLERQTPVTAYTYSPDIESAKKLIQKNYEDIVVRTLAAKKEYDSYLKIYKDEAKQRIDSIRIPGYRNKPNEKGELDVPDELLHQMMTDGEKMHLNELAKTVNYYLETAKMFESQTKEYQRAQDMVDKELKVGKYAEKNIQQNRDNSASPSEPQKTPIIAPTTELNPPKEPDHSNTKTLTPEPAKPELNEPKHGPISRDNYGMGTTIKLMDQHFKSIEDLESHILGKGILDYEIKNHDSRSGLFEVFIPDTSSSSRFALAEACVESHMSKWVEEHNEENGLTKKEFEKEKNNIISLYKFDKLTKSHDKDKIKSVESKKRNDKDLADSRR